MSDRIALGTDSHAAASRRSCATACSLLASLLSACTLPHARHEIILSDDGTKRDGAVAATVDAATAPANAPTVGSPANSAAGTSVGTSASDGGLAQAGGSNALPGLFPNNTPDAGRPPANDASTDAQQASDEATCFLNFAGCALFDPLLVADCATKAGPNCPELLGLDAGTAPSPACSMQEADCLMRNPSQVDMCMAMLATCKL